MRIIWCTQARKRYYISVCDVCIARISAAKHEILYTKSIKNFIRIEEFEWFQNQKDRKTWRLRKVYLKDLSEFFWIQNANFGISEIQTSLWDPQIEHLQNRDRCGCRNTHGFIFSEIPYSPNQNPHLWKLKCPSPILKVHLPTLMSHTTTFRNCMYTRSDRVYASIKTWKNVDRGNQNNFGYRGKNKVCSFCISKFTYQNLNISRYQNQKKSSCCAYYEFQSAATWL